MPIKLLCVGYYCSIFARWRHWIKWIIKIRVNIPCSAYTCLMCAKNHLLIFSSFLDIWENVEWPRFFGPPCITIKKTVNSTIRHRCKQCKAHTARYTAKLFKRITSRHVAGGVPGGPLAAPWDCVRPRLNFTRLVFRLGQQSADCGELRFPTFSLVSWLVANSVCSYTFQEL